MDLPSNANTRPACLKQPGRTALALLVAATFFMENLDATIIATALPNIARSIGTDPLDLNIGISAYVIALALFTPVSGWLADRWGARTIFALAIMNFTIASALCALSTNLETFVAFRLLQGVGGAMMVPVGRLVVLRSTPKADLISAIALLTWPALTAPVLGPALGGFLTQHFGWEWIFLINLPVGILAFVAAIILVPNFAEKTARPFDWVGFLGCSLSITALMIMFEMIGQRDASPVIILALAVTAGSTGLLTSRHLKRSTAPLVALSAMGARTFAITIWGGSLFRMSVSAVPLLLPLLFQLGFGMDPFHAGLLVLVLFAGNLAMKPATTPILRRFGFTPVLICNGVLVAASMLGIIFLTPATSLLIILPLLFAGGMSRSMQFTSLNTIAFADIPEEGIGDANTLFNIVMQISMGLGIALGALSLRLSEMIVSTFDLLWPACSFRLAFVPVAMIALLAVLDTLRLEQQAGQNLTK